VFKQQNSTKIVVIKNYKMNKYLIILLVFVLPGYNPIKPNKKNIACCGSTAINDFARLGSIPDFVRSHPNPRPLKGKVFEGMDIHFPGTDGKEAHGYEFQTKKQSNKFLFVIHDYFGLGDYAKTESEKFFHDLKDVNVIALDLYDNKSTLNRDTAAKYMQQVTQDRAFAIINGAIKMVGEKAKIGTIGWCFGGGWSLQTAIAAGAHTEACVVYYGMPEKDINKLKSLHSDVLGIFADKDKWINKDVVAGFQKNMEAAGKTLTIKHYDADHGFGNPTTAQHDGVAAADAYKNAITYLKSRLG
jgi:carboxymethylenebutenolidase